MNPVMFTVFKIDIRWYSVLILVGTLIGVYLLKREAKRFGMNWDFIFNLSFWTIVFGILGARLYYVIFNWSQYENDLLSIFKIWEGGLAIHGGILAGALTVYFYCKKAKANTLKIIDMALPSVIIAQAIGRWGNFFNSEAYGSVTSLTHLEKLHIPKFIIDGMYIDGVYRQPTFLYESIWCLLGFIILLVIRRNKYTKVGTITGTYLMWYSAGRFFIERMRTDSLMLGGFRVAQIISIILFVLGAILVMKNKRQGKFENLYNSDKDNNIRF
ncbi:MAG: prolipoprotein diacylglyceryl transferase [Bacilli bacterium]|nr:prolipoprotein diacylglyceryl transferase [Bacilli bacterium]